MTQNNIADQLEAMADRIEERIENLSLVYKMPHLPPAVGAVVTADSCMSALLQMLRAALPRDDAELSKIHLEMLESAAEIATSCVASVLENMICVLAPTDEKKLADDILRIVQMRHTLQVEILKGAA